MTKLNKTEIKAIRSMVSGGFTFYGDNFANTFNKTKRALSMLVTKGFAIKNGDEFFPTEKSKDFVKYGIVTEAGTIPG